MINYQECENKNDNELVGLTRKNPDFFACLIKKYETQLLAYIKRIAGVSNEDAEDILQNSFIKAYRHINEFDNSLKFSSWIYRIVRNETIDNFRSRQSKGLNNTTYNEDVLLNIASNINIEREIDQKILKKQMAQLLNKLDLKYREVLILRFLEEKDYQEIADIIKKPIGTVSTLIRRAKKNLKKEIENNFKQI